MSQHEQITKKDAITEARFERACALIYLDFQNTPEPKDRRCVRRITAWDKVYLVQFYWGSPIFLSKQKYLSSGSQLTDDTGLVREFSDPYRLRKNGYQKTRKRHKADLRWNKETHQKWIDEHKLEIRLFWARKKYYDLGDSEELVNLKASYELLGIEPFSSPEMVRNAYHKEAKIFHPDFGGNTESFVLLKEAYKTALQKSRSIKNNAVLKR